MTPALENEFAREVHSGLSGPGQKTLPCRYLYDDVGSALFEAITYLSEYGLTRADARVLQQYAGEMVDCMDSQLVVAELGSGSGIKTRPVLESLQARQPDINYYPIDLSRTALVRCAQELEGLAQITTIEKSYLDGMREVAALRKPGDQLLLLFLGSTIGNFEPDCAADFLLAIRNWMQPGDGLLLGTDLVKPVDRLLAAYDDPSGVTAAFNLNLLARINRELEGDFNLRHFHHEARYQPDKQRVEMHLRSRAHQLVRIGKSLLTAEFAAGETILTEVCYKFRVEQIATLARTSGFHVERQWVDAEWGFAESLLRY